MTSNTDYTPTVCATLICYIVIAGALAEGHNTPVLIFLAICAGIGLIIAIGVAVMLAFIKRGMTKAVRAAQAQRNRYDVDLAEYHSQHGMLTGFQWGFGICFTVASTLALPVAIQFMIYDFKDTIPE